MDKSITNTISLKFLKSHALIIEGSVKVLKNVSDSLSDLMERIAILGTGETFGEMAIVDLQEWLVTVRTLEQTIVLKLWNKKIFDIAKKYNYIYSIVIMDLAREISRCLRVIDDRYAITLFSHQH